MSRVVRETRGLLDRASFQLTDPALASDGVSNFVHRGRDIIHIASRNISNASVRASKLPTFAVWTSLRDTLLLCEPLPSALGTLINNLGSRLSDHWYSVP